MKWGVPGYGWGVWLGMNQVTMNKILVIDDNFKIYKSLELNLKKEGFSSRAALNSAEAIAALDSERPDIILLDLALREESGLDLLRIIKKTDSTVPVIMITGYGTLESAVKAIKLGAFDFLEKPLQFEKLLSTINNALEMTKLKNENRELKEKINVKRGGIITRNQQMLELCEKACKLAVTDIPILITGESGTGKELVADMVHENSIRKDKLLVKLNCSALPEHLLDSELFGHEKGSFTGAVEAHTGVFEQACGSSLHLDEIGDMAISTQAKILRAIQYGEIRRIGGNSPVKVDVRFIASTNKDLNMLIEQGLFREDLMYRLNASCIHLPPLRERKEDIPVLVATFIRDFQREGENRWFSNAALEKMQEYDWDGNVRELRNIVRVTLALSDKEVIEADAISLPKKVLVAPASVLEGDLRSSERLIIVDALNSTGNNRSAAAVKLGISRKTLYNKIEKYGIK